MKFFKDLFMGPGNKAWDLGRVMAAQAIGAYIFAFLYALIWLNVVPDWNSLGIGFAGVLGGSAAFIGVKDAVFNKAAEQVREHKEEMKK